MMYLCTAVLGASKLPSGNALQASVPTVHYASYDTSLNAPTYASTFPFNVTMLMPEGLPQQGATEAGDPWPCGGWGCGHKMRAHQRFVESIPDDDLVVLFDSRDVMFGGCASPSATFAALGHRVVFGAEVRDPLPDHASNEHTLAGARDYYGPSDCMWPRSDCMWSRSHGLASAPRLEQFGCFPADAVCATNRSQFANAHPLSPAALQKNVRCDATCTDPPTYRFVNSGLVAGKAVRDTGERTRERICTC
jgi:hypothetical protein